MKKPFNFKQHQTVEFVVPIHNQSLGRVFRVGSVTHRISETVEEQVVRRIEKRLADLGDEPQNDLSGLLDKR